MGKGNDENISKFLKINDCQKYHKLWESKNSHIKFQKHHLDFIGFNQIIYAYGLLSEHIQYLFQGASEVI